MNVSFFFLKTRSSLFFFKDSLNILEVPTYFWSNLTELLEKHMVYSCIDL